jgi:hypothetical protein
VARPNSRVAGRAAWLLAVVIFAASVAWADDDLPPGFKADPNDPFKDGQGTGSKPHGSSTWGTGSGSNVSPNWTEPGANYVPPPLRPPLDTKEEGQPIDASQSPNAVLDYVDREMRQHTEVAGGERSLNGNIVTIQPYRIAADPGFQSAIEPILAKFGAANLQAAIQKNPSPHSGVDGADDEYKEFEMGLLSGGLYLATASSRPAPVILTEEDEIDTPLNSDARIAPTDRMTDEEVLNSLSRFDDTDRIDMVTENALQHGLWSSNSTVQAKFAEILNRWIAKTDRGTEGEAMQGLDDFMIEVMTIPNEPVQALFPEWAAMKVHLHKLKQDKNPMGYESFIEITAAKIQNRKDAFAAEPVREGVQTLIAPLNGQADSNVVYDFLAAETGDAVAYSEMLQAYSRMPVAPTGNGQQAASPGGPGGLAADSGTPGNDHNADNQGVQDNSPVILNGNPVKDAWEIKQFAVSLMRNTQYVGTGKKKAGILSHLDHAVYNQGKWTVTDPSFAAASSFTPTGAAPNPPSSTAPAVVPGGN